MIRTTVSITVFSLVAILACTSAAGMEPNDANIPLAFEASLIELPAPHLQQVRAIPSPWKGTVTHAAGVVCSHTSYFPQHGSGDIYGFIGFAERQDISAEQRRFLETTAGGLEASHAGGSDPHTLPDFYTPPEDPNSPQFLLYAVSLDDAQKMAEAYLQYARNSFKEKISPMQEEVKRLSERLADEQQKQPGAGQAAQAAKKSFEEMEKQVPYRDDKQALDAAAELDKMLNTAQVEIAGIRAKIEAIQGYQKPHEGDPILDPKLELMFIEEAVALQGAEARRRMATTLRKQADSYIDLKAAWQQAEAEKEHIDQDLSVLPELVDRAREALAREMLPEPKIINNKVFIYPIKPVEERRGMGN